MLTPLSRHASCYHLIGRLFWRVSVPVSIFFLSCPYFSVCVFCFRAPTSFAVPFEEDPRNPSIWYLDHNFLEGGNKTYLPCPPLRSTDACDRLEPRFVADEDAHYDRGSSLGPYICPGSLANIVGIPAISLYFYFVNHHFYFPAYCNS